VDEARIRGAEFNYEWHTDAWRLWGNYTQQDPQNLTTHEQLLRRSHYNLAAGMQFDHGPWYLSADMQLAGPHTDFVGFSLGTVGGYTLVNLGAGYQFARQWQVQLRVDNALDREYQLASGYNTARRSVTLAMRFHMR
jgi:vitamin B12 transporter